MVVAVEEEDVVPVLVQVPVPGVVRDRVQAMTAIQDRAVVTEQIQNATLTLNQRAPNCRRERAVNGEVEKMPIVLQLPLQHRNHRDVASVEIQNVTPTMSRRAINLQREKAVNGEVERFVICH